MIKRFVFQPPGPLPSVNLLSLRRFMSVVRETDADIYYIHIRSSASPLNINSEKRPLTILYNHGNAEDLGTTHEGLMLLSYALGIDIIVYDYCGYGFSKTRGRCTLTEKTVYRDADAMYCELTERLHISPERIIIMGRSMGGGPACYLAQKHHSSIGGLILLSAFTSCLGAVRCSCLRYLGVKDMFLNEKFLKKVDACPVLLLHGKKDAVVSFSCAEKLLKVLKKARLAHGSEARVYYHWFDDCGHNDVESLGWDKLVNMILVFANGIASCSDKKNLPPDNIVR